MCRKMVKDIDPEEIARENEIDPKQSNPYGEKFEGEAGSPEDLARFFELVKMTEEEALSAKHLEWGWKNFGPMDGQALAYVIKNNKTCITLDLFVNELFVGCGTTVAKAMSENTKIKSLDLQQAQIGPAGAQAMAETLKVNKTLMNLKMHYNHLGPEGCAYLADALKVNKTLTNIVLSDNGIMKEGAEALASMLETNTTLMRLDISKNAGVTNPTATNFVDPSVKPMLTAAGEKHEAKRKAAQKLTPHDKLPFKLLMEDSPGQMWSPNGFVNIVKHPKQRRPKRDKGGAE